MLRGIVAFVSLCSCTDPQVAPPDAGFALELAAPRARVALGEPVHLIATLRNVSDTERSVRDLLDPAFGFLRVRVKRPGEEKASSWQPLAQREGRGRRPQPVPPGGTLDAPVAIFAGRDGWLLDRPGTYEVSAEFGFEEGRVVAKPAQLEVVAPSGDGERKAAELMLRREVARFLLLGGGAASDEGRALLEQLERDHAQSLLAPYAKVALAIADAHESFDPDAKQVRPAQPKAAVERIEAALPRVQDPVFAVAAIETLVRSLRSLGRGDEATKALRGFEERRAKQLGAKCLAERVQALEVESTKAPAKQPAPTPVPNPTPNSMKGDEP
jgi:hypothetical protein